MTRFLDRLARRTLQARPQVRAAGVPLGFAAPAPLEAPWAEPPADEEAASGVRPPATVPQTRAAPQQTRPAMEPHDLEPHDLELHQPAPLVPRDVPVHAPAADPAMPEPAPVASVGARRPLRPDEPAPSPADSVLLAPPPAPSTAASVAAPVRPPTARAQAPEPLVRAPRGAGPAGAAIASPLSPAGHHDAAEEAVEGAATGPRRAAEPDPLLPARTPLRPAAQPPARGHTAAAALPPREARLQAPREEPTTVQVTIGRIEIAAIAPPPAPVRAPAAGARPLSLDDYLARRGRR